MLTLAFPWIFFALPLPWIVRRFWQAVPAPSSGKALRVPFFQLLRHLVQQLSAEKVSTPYRSRNIIAYVIWFLLILAISGPQWLGKPMIIPRLGRNLMLVVDLSGSMALPDFTLNGAPSQRLTIIKTLAADFIKKRQGDRLGLIVFGNKAYVRVPLTHDTKYVEKTLQATSVGLAGETTAIGDAIGLAVKCLRQTKATSRAIILLTDGANNAGLLSPQQAATIAASAKIRIYPIAVGAEQLSVATPFGNRIINPSADLDENTLKTVAQLSHGDYFRGKNTTDLRAIYEKINTLEPAITQPIIMQPYAELYPYPLVIALCLIIFIMQRHWQKKRLAKPRALSLSAERS